MPLYLKFPAFLFLLFLGISSCNPKSTKEHTSIKPTNVNLPIENETKEIIVGAERMQEYIPLLQGKNVALVVNHTSMIKEKHLVDTLQNLNIGLKSIFAPEHGFRGSADAGASIKDGIDEKSGLPVISLYGKNKKPSKTQLQGIDIVIFDIQDVGARFYTYISTMHYVMEACAENNIPVIILDRPNPNGHYVDGPVLEMEHQSFVGMHPIPIIHGLTVGELAQMINGEEWLKGKIKCNLTIVKCENYDHDSFYELPIAPSPNLPNMKSIYLYPSLCLFEGTNVSIGRGTDKQFQVIGSPDFQGREYAFTPMPKAGAKYPKHEGKVCYGYDLSLINIKELQEKREFDLNFLLNFYKNSAKKPHFFIKNNFFTKLMGNKVTKQEIINDRSIETIKKQWVKGINNYKLKRKK
ncbi:MAG: exo-beta-N-acetylmuramidase NamZ family protein, partial [Saprospiraceae bacterium]